MIRLQIPRRSNSTPDDLEPGQYQLRTEAVSAFGSARYQDTGPTFRVPAATDADANTAAQTNTRESDAADETAPDTRASSDEDTSATEDPSSSSGDSVDSLARTNTAASADEPETDSSTAIADDASDRDQTETDSTREPETDAIVSNTDAVTAATDEPDGSSTDTVADTVSSSSALQETVEPKTATGAPPGTAAKAASSAEPKPEPAATIDTPATEKSRSNAAENAADAVEVPRLHIATSTVTGSHRVTVDAPDAVYVELFAVRMGARRPTFLGVARRSARESWVTTIGPDTLPVGTYDLYARIENESGDLARTPPVTHTSALAPDTTARDGKPRPPAASNAQDTIGTASADYFDTQPEHSTHATSARTAEAAALQLLRERRTALTGQLERYASAVRSENVIALDRARAALETTRGELATAALRDGRTTDIANRVDAALGERISTLTERVDRYVELQTAREAAVRTRDSDGDGITDADETALYGTDPTVADTDQDGITDGVEIMSGFDPLRAAAEARVTYESPREAGLVDADTLAVTEIAPVFESDAERGTPSVQARIGGRGLPNSYVTLFIYSTPIIVTVATNDDGSFTYTLQKKISLTASTRYSLRSLITRGRSSPRVNHLRSSKRRRRSRRSKLALRHPPVQRMRAQMDRTGDRC